MGVLQQAELPQLPHFTKIYHFVALAHPVKLVRAIGILGYFLPNLPMAADELQTLFVCILPNQPMAANEF
jgi:hypothetical protein